MLVYSSEFPLSNESIENYNNCLKKWLFDSPHYPWNTGDDIIFPDDNEDIIKYEKNGYILQLAKVIQDDIKIVGINFYYTEKNERDWTTEIIATKKSESSIWITVKVFCDLLKPGLKPPKVKKTAYYKNFF